MIGPEMPMRDHSAWWPLKWIFLLLVAALAVASLRHPERSQGEWGLLPALVLCPPLLAIVARDIALLIWRRESIRERCWRVASSVLAMASLGALLWQIS